MSVFLCGRGWSFSGKCKADFFSERSVTTEYLSLRMKLLIEQRDIE
jgi:hypothetical protein